MATASFWTQFKILFWKNLLLKKRNKKQTIYEIFLPIYFIAILAIVKLTVKSDALKQAGPFPEKSLYSGHFNQSGKYTSGKFLVVSPDNTETRNVMADTIAILQQLQGFSSVPDVHYHDNNTEAESEFNANSSNVVAGIIFNYTDGGILNYAIRMSQDSIPGSKFENLFALQSQCRNGEDGVFYDNCDAQKYFLSGFAALQTAIETALLRVATGNSTLEPPNIESIMLPKPVFNPDSNYIQVISAMYFVIAYSPFINYLTVHLVAEKEKKIKEGMKMMGLRDPAFWLSWSSLYMIFITVVTAVVTVIAVASRFFVNSNVFLFFILLLFYGFTILGISFLITPFFNKARTAGGLASLASMVFSCLYLIVSLTRTYVPGSASVEYTVPVWGRWLLCLLSPVALSLGMDQAIFLDLRGGMNFSTASDGDFPFYAPLVMLLVDTVLYFMLALYFDRVIPGEYGPRYKPCFMFSKSYWTSEKSNAVDLSNQYLLDLNEQGQRNSYTTPRDDIKNSDIEPVPAEMNQNIAVRINKLTKTFKTKEEGPVKAVNELSLTIYENQITAILGHNGAGKTTTMNILTGLMGATSGHASIYGHDVSDIMDMEKIRAMTGVCPQHNILFDELTCTEHLQIFGGIKGVPADKIEQETKEALDSVDLSDQADVQSSKLSGGQKRKLSVAIAIIGDPKIIFLDEPTAGMDPYSRRHLWSILKKKKVGRVILLTTHFMDEADILADRKAIINKGSLRCCGSSLFLKSRFGIGYHLNMVVEPNCDSTRINDLVSNIVEGSEINRVHGREVDITLPLNALTNFPRLFSVLEDTKQGQSTAESLGIKSYGVSMTTLEEVFLKLEEDATEDATLTESGFSNRVYEKKTTDSAGYTDVNLDLQVGCEDPSLTVECVTDEKQLAWQKFKALFKINILKNIRNKAALVFQTILPAVLVVVGLVMAKTINNNNTSQDRLHPPALTMNPAYYAKMTALNNSQYFPYSTVPRLLLKDTANTTASQTFLTTLGLVFSTYKETSAESADPFMLLEQSPFYMGVDIAALDVSGQNITYTAMYNDSAIHSVPVTINMMTNGVLRMLTGSTNITITSSSLPWPSTKVGPQFNNAAFVSSLLIAMAFIFIPGGFAVDVVKDRQMKVRSQLRVSGVPFSVYWASLFTVDFIKFIIPAVFTVIVTYIVTVDSLTPGGAVLSFILVVLMYIPANIFFAYFTSFMYDKWETAQAAHTFLIFMFGYIPYFPVSFVDMLANEDTASILHIVFCIIDPPYNIFGGIYYINKIYTKAQFTQTEDNISFGEYFKFGNNIVICYLMNLIHIFLFFFLLRVMDIRATGGDVREACFPGSKRRGSQVIPERNEDVIQGEDSDVFEERSRVKQMMESGQTPVGMVENLRKEFRKAAKTTCKKGQKKDKVKVAVRNATLAVNTGEVFGLLGPNGAGKTTTLNMMTADIGPTKGKVAIGGHDIRSSMSEAFQAMGYCPQHDALWDVITLKEHLQCYSLVRGIPPEKTEEITDFFIQNLKLDEHSEKRSKKLSGGTKRKLSYSMSMLGRPKIVLLDEPSTGMDPQSKRFLWDTISSSFENTERGAILTTHYMEEADALCSRIAIMVNGKIECLGSSQHLKNKYGSGYLLEVKLSVGADIQSTVDDQMDKLDRYISQLFPHAICMERFGERAQYKIPRENVTSLAHAFTVLEEGKVHHSIEEYSFSQATLEQVFLEFAKKQLEEGQSEEENELNKQRSLSHSLKRKETDESLSLRL